MIVIAITFAFCVPSPGFDRRSRDRGHLSPITTPTSSAAAPSPPSCAHDAASGSVVDPSAHNQGNRTGVVRQCLRSEFSKCGNPTQSNWRAVTDVGETSATATLDGVDLLQRHTMRVGRSRSRAVEARRLRSASSPSPLSQLPLRDSVAVALLQPCSVRGADLAIATHALPIRTRSEMTARAASYAARLPQQVIELGGRANQILASDDAAIPPRHRSRRSSRRRKMVSLLLFGKGKHFLRAGIWLDRQNWRAHQRGNRS